MSEMIEVTKTDANNYCRVLRALGMEEEGDPVAEIERLKAVSKGPSTINAIPRMGESLMCRLMNVRIIGSGRIPKEDLKTIDDAIEAISAAAVLERFANWILDEYHSEDEFPEAKEIVREARAALLPSGSSR